MEIIKSLNLNVTPKDAPNGSLVYARNVMTDDTSSFLTNDIGFDKVLDFKHEERIVGIIPCSEEIVIFTYRPAHRENDVNYTEQHQIYRLPDNGNQDDLIPVQSNWKWSGGKINGSYTYNYKGELIVAVGESSDDKQIPLKSFIIKRNSNGDYANNNPTYNIEEIIPKYDSGYDIGLNGNLVCGCYTYFIRFNIDDYNYTKWFQITGDILIIQKVKSKKYTHTFQVGNYPKNSVSAEENADPVLVNSDDISNKNILLHITLLEHTNFNKCQIGYIIKRKSDVQGRILNNYSFTPNIGTNTSSLDINIVNNNYLEEISVDALLENPHQFFNVKNVITYNNRLYIANYEEYKNDNFTSNKSNIDLAVINGTISQESQASSQTVIRRYNMTLNIKSKLSSSYAYDESFTLYGLTFDNTDKMSSADSIAFIQKLADNIAYKYRVSGIGSTETTIVESYLSSYLEDITMSLFWFLQKGTANNRQEVCIFSNIGGSGYNGFADTPWSVFNTHIPTFNIVLDEANRGLILRVEDNGNIYNYSLTDPAGSTVIGRRYYENPIDPEDITHYYLYGGNEITEAQASLVVNSLFPLDIIISVENLTYDEVIIDDDDIDPIDPGDDNYIPGSVKYIDVNTRTLIPYQKYNFFIHYIRKDGSVTLGYPIALKSYYTDFGKIIIPTFKVNVNPNPNEFIGYFISYENIERNVENVYLYDIDNDSYVSITNAQKLYDLDSIRGSKLRKDKDTSYTIDLTTIKDVTNRLIQNHTEFKLVDAINKINIPIFIWSSFNEKNTYISNTKLLFRLTKNMYNFGEYVYDQDYAPDFLNRQIIVLYRSDYKFLIIDPANEVVIGMNELANQVTKIAASYKIYLNDNNRFYCKYPTEAMNIKQDFIITSRVNDAGETLVVNCVIPPSALHDFLELQPAYSSLPSKSFTNFKNTIISKFDKTIYRSDVVSDESLVNGFRHFATGQYKNIFENKGNITNIVSIGLYFIVHTEYSIFVFDRSPKLSQYAQIEIPDTFDVDYQELMPTNEGYGGLLDREESIITKHGYFWYDKTNKIIFSFDQGKPSMVSSAINNYIKQLPIETCRFAEDILHNRLIVCFKLSGEKYITLSYNLNTKQFISFHDYRFTYNYKTYGKSYLFDESIENRNKLFVFDDRLPVNYDDLGITIGIDSGERYNVGDDTNNAGVNPSIIDIIFNEGFEVPKVLNSINYVLSKFNHNDAVYLPQILREYDDRLFPGDYIKIYTDEVITDVINVKDTKENVNDYETYTKPKWEKGKWNLNYFRDIHHVNEEIGYTSDQESLVFGKYFVVRFIFENDVNNPTRFKLDNVNVNFELY